MSRDEDDSTLPLNDENTVAVGTEICVVDTVGKMVCVGKMAESSTCALLLLMTLEGSINDDFMAIRVLNEDESELPPDVVDGVTVTDSVDR